MVLFSTMGVSLKDAYGKAILEVKKIKNRSNRKNKFFTKMEKDSKKKEIKCL